MEINYYLAKSNPKETIQEHTDKLLENYEILKNLYPNLFLNWDTSYILKLACLYHDIGKMNLEFQNVLMGKCKKQRLNHGVYSLCFINWKKIFEEVKEKYTENIKDEEIVKYKVVIFLRILYNIIAYHHEREIPNDYIEIIKENFESLKEQSKNFKYNKLKIEVLNSKISANFFSPGKRILPGDLESEDSQIFDKFVLLKGLLNRIDYAASAGIEVEKQNDFLLEALDKMMLEWKKKEVKSDWNDLQKYMLENKEKNLIAIAQTGMGKTEAGLLWIGNNKGFFILPLKAAINAIYKRITSDIVKDKLEERVGLLHSETKEQYLEDSISYKEMEEYYEKTRQLSLPLTVCTLDQLFSFIYKYKGFEAKLATLSYSKLVIDEIQMYSPDLVAYIVKGLATITRLGGKFVILTATFPRIFEDFLKKENIVFDISPKFIKKNLNLRHNVKVIEKCIDSEFVLSKFKNNKILVICNTVKEAQRVYKEISEKMEDKQKVNLFHSKYIKEHRRKKEEEILKIGNKNSKDTGIWITTQVVEVSLDIDFDILVTELSDLNGVFQRMGRCYRNRPLINDLINCYIYIGNSKKKNTGVGYVIDKDIYLLSRKFILNKINGKLYEEQKMEYIEELYTVTNLKNTKYYEKIEDTLNYLELLSPYELEKREVEKNFRDITNYSIIPKNIYNFNKEKINKYLHILKLNNDETNIENLREQKILAKIKIRDLIIDIQKYEFKDGIKFSTFESIELGKNEKIYILDCEYSYEYGLEILKGRCDDIIENNFL